MEDTELEQNESKLVNRNKPAVDGVVLLNGAAGIAGGVVNNLSINEPIGYNNYTQTVKNSGLYGYNSFSDILQDHSLTDNNFMRPKKNEIRGMDKKQKIENVVNLGLSGAVTGAQAGSFWGGLAGLGIGTAAGIGSVVQGDNNANAIYDYNNTELNVANMYSADNRRAAVEDFMDRRFEDGVLTVKARGGRIARRNFADRLLGIKNTPSRSAGIIREKVDGGIRIKIKR